MQDNHPMNGRLTHKSVLLNEVINILDPKPGEFFIDGTMDGGGHARAILEKISPNGIFLGLDWDNRMIENFRLDGKYRNKTILISDNFKNIPLILKAKKLEKANGLILDLGFSSEQIEAGGRGFSFLRNEPLKMTYSDSFKPAYEWLNRLRIAELAKIIKDFGEEKFANQIAHAIKKNLPILTSGKLVDVIRAAVPKSYERGRINPATRTFQALRIFVNEELENLKEILRIVPQILLPNGRLAIISFHSLEDRIVKNAFRELQKSGQAEILTKKPIISSRAETLINPRSRSAKLRAISII